MAAKPMSMLISIVLRANSLTNRDSPAVTEGCQDFAFSELPLKGDQHNINMADNRHSSNLKSAGLSEANALVLV
jgi:hypothetical protein